jgi:hypothetical protein
MRKDTPPQKVAGKWWWRASGGGGQVVADVRIFDMAKIRGI